VSVFADVAEHVVLTPHMAWYTEESERDLRVKAAHEARRLLEGERPRDVVVEPEEART
jgi:D-3-phosphoglycerate dehydrogenase / 2-oxoglutarate reductase